MAGNASQSENGCLGAGSGKFKRVFVKLSLGNVAARKASSDNPPEGACKALRKFSHFVIVQSLGDSLAYRENRMLCASESRKDVTHWENICFYSFDQTIYFSEPNKKRAMVNGFFGMEEKKIEM